MLGSSKITNVACLGVFDLGTDSALSRQPECAKTFHMGLYDPPPLKWSRRTIFDRNVFFRIATVHPPTPAIAALQHPHRIRWNLSIAHTTPYNKISMYGGYNSKYLEDDRTQNTAAHAHRTLQGALADLYLRGGAVAPALDAAD